MHLTRLALLTALCGLTTFWCARAPAQNYPSKPIRIVIAGIGGTSDIAARLFGQELTASWGQPVIVDPRPSGFIPVEIVAKAAPDGYTLLLSGSVLWLAPFLQENVPYDPVRDFTPITLALSSPNILVVHPSLPVKSVRELIALAKAKPGALNFGSAGTASTSHLAAELFNSMAGVKIVGIPYKGAAQALSDLIGGQVQLIFATAASSTVMIKSGRLKTLAVTSAQPSMLASELPTVAASGLPGYESILTVALLAPSGTPMVIVSRLNGEIVRVLNKLEVEERFFISAVEVVGSTPEQLGAIIKSDMAKMSKLVTDTGLRIL